MSRKIRKRLKKISYDIFFNCRKINKIINIIMKHGKKKKSENLFYKSMNFIRLKYKKNPYRIFLDCLKNSMPIVNVKKRKIGGSIFNIPIKLDIDKSMFIAFKNIVRISRNKVGYFYVNLANEIYETSCGFSDSVRCRDEMHKISENNRAFSHFI
ncbi:SSU ribosomal protein S7p (S5e) [Candidatus Vidania fulgoroideae]|uniref:SSU ribosomal protein S7p (S5e) n=1 Tax=Candidatus Vidania fulgoroideorum TaxID=881286 RepID=A0A346E0B3_9PROT|nr:SSU ribosomal protein S7p (S5e) [Candidatus Vidania fulgoroideae]